MQTKDYVYLGLIALSAIVFYWHGYLAARSRVQKSFTSIFNDRRTLVEMPSTDVESASPTRGQRTLRPLRSGRRTTKIRAVFGTN